MITKKKPINIVLGIILIGVILGALYLNLSPQPEISTLPFTPANEDITDWQEAIILSPDQLNTKAIEYIRDQVELTQITNVNGKVIHDYSKIPIYEVISINMIAINTYDVIVKVIRQFSVNYNYLYPTIANPILTSNVTVQAPYAKIVHHISSSNDPNNYIEHKFYQQYTILLETFDPFCKAANFQYILGSISFSTNIVSGSYNIGELNSRFSCEVSGRMILTTI